MSQSHAGLPRPRQPARRLRRSVIDSKLSALLLAAGILLSSAAVVAAKRCEGGRFVVDGSPVALREECTTCGRCGPSCSGYPYRCCYYTCCGPPTFTGTD